MLTSSVIAILKAMTDTIILEPSLGGGAEFFYLRFFLLNKREYSGADWLVPLLYFWEYHDIWNKYSIFFFNILDKLSSNCDKL